MTEPMLSPRGKAVLTEVATAVQALLAGGEAKTLYLDKMGLSLEERQAIRDILGTGQVRTRLEGTAEPAEWLESGVSGVWYGVFYGQTGNPVLETLEICWFPTIAAAQPEDVRLSAQRLQTCLQEE